MNKKILLLLILVFSGLKPEQVKPEQVKPEQVKPQEQSLLEKKVNLLSEGFKIMCSELKDVKLDLKQLLIEEFKMTEKEQIKPQETESQEPGGAVAVTKRLNLKRLNLKRGRKKRIK